SSPSVSMTITKIRLQRAGGSGIRGEEIMSAVAEPIKGWLNAGLGFIYPEVCQLCGDARATPAEGYVCAGCRAEAQFIEEPFCERCGLPFEGAITVKFECTNCRDAELHFGWARSAVVARDGV